MDYWNTHHMVTTWWSWCHVTGSYPWPIRQSSRLNSLFQTSTRSYCEEKRDWWAKFTQYYLNSEGIRWWKFYSYSGQGLITMTKKSTPDQTHVCSFKIYLTLNHRQMEAMDAMMHAGNARSRLVIHLKRFHPFSSNPLPANSFNHISFLHQLWRPKPW